MNLFAVALITLILLPTALFHIYWALGGRYGSQVAVPQKPDGTALFTPSPAMTFGVAIMLFIILSLMLIFAFQIPLPISIPRFWQQAAMVGFGVVFLIRGLSWHRYVGLFKKVRQTPFGKNDTKYYCPAIIITGLTFLFLAWQG